MGAFGQSLIYICGNKAYDNELAMYRHEGIACHRRCNTMPVLDARPRLAYRISLGGKTRWSTDPVDACRARRETPDASVAVVAVQR